MNVAQLDVKPGDKWCFPGDMHHDQQDQAAVETMLAACSGEGVRNFCLIGDTMHSMGISRHSQLKAARHYRGGAGTAKAEARAAGPNLQAMRTLSLGQGQLHVLPGNHEKWWDLVQDDYPGLLDTQWHELYGDTFDGWTIHDELTALKLGPLLVQHGHRVRGSLAKFSAATVLNNYPGQNTLYGHTHRLEGCTTPTYKDGRPDEHGAWTIGHLRRRDKELEDKEIGPHSERHQQGFAIVSFFARGMGRHRRKLGFDVQLVKIHRTTAGKPIACVGGRVYRG